ncbi:MAG: hypothetical protein M0O97_05135 [Arcobacteraceae bacterium]|nr:hypothetical protein [Arcobacteraceae bacterium]
MKMHDKTARIRYIRVIDKFISRVFSLAKSEDIDFETFALKVDRFYQEFKKTPKVELYSTYCDMQEKLIELVLYIVNSKSEDFSLDKSKIIKEINLLEKYKNNSSYKKEKHKNKKFDDGY